MTAPNFDTLFAPAFDAMADRARDIILPYFRKPLAVEDKADASPVTQADQETEAALRDFLRAHFPSHGIIGEEYGNENTDAEFVWVLDPIDGTKSFISGIPLFGTVIGLLYQGRPVAGLVDQPYTRERWFGVDRAFCRFNGQDVRVAAPCTLAKARCCTYLLEKAEDGTAGNARALRNAVRTIRYNMDCYPYALLSIGCVDLVVENGLKFHDIAGVIPLITGAGGFVADWSKKTITSTTFDGDILAATTELLADEALKAMQDRP